MISPFCDNDCQKPAGQAAVFDTAILLIYTINLVYDKCVKNEFENEERKSMFNYWEKGIIHWKLINSTE